MRPEEIEWPCKLAPATKHALISAARPLMLDATKQINFGSKGTNGLYYLSDGLAVLGLRRQLKAPPLVLIERGQWFGALLVFGRPEFAYRMTAVDYAALVHIPDEAVRSLADAHAEIFKFLYFMDARHIRETLDMLFATTGMAMAQRVAYLLLKISDRFAATADDEPVIPFGHTALCKLLGLSRPSLSRELATLRVSGIIGVERKRVRILDAAALQRVATGAQKS